MRRMTLAAISLLALAACRQDDTAGLPPAVTMSSDALGYYCQMVLTEHPGPKAQVHLVGLENPIFFSQVRDGIAYQRMPEQSNRIAVMYVSDMGAAPSWQDPGVDNWIPASAAFYVIGSDAVGGMGAQEPVPFSDRTAATAFAAEHGGRIVSLSEIADSEVLAPSETRPGHEEDNDYLKRLKSLSHEGNG